MSDAVKQEEMEKAMEELDQIEKSQQGHADETLDELTKSLEEELGEDLGEDLTKACNGKEDKEKEENYDDDLVKASEAYADLENSVHAGFGGIAAEMEAIRKAIASNMNLNIKMAKVLAGLSKSMSDVEGLTKSVSELAKAPTTPNTAVLGVGTSGASELKKSSSEIQDSLLKAVQDGHVDPRFLSIYATYKDVNRLPSEVRTAIGC